MAVIRRAEARRLHRHTSDFRIEIEECREAGAELFFDVVLAALEDVHSDVSFAPVLKLDGGFADFNDFVGREQAEPVNESEVCHEEDCTEYRVGAGNGGPSIIYNASRETDGPDDRDAWS